MKISFSARFPIRDSAEEAQLSVEADEVGVVIEEEDVRLTRVRMTYAEFEQLVIAVKHARDAAGTLGLEL